MPDNRTYFVDARPHKGRGQIISFAVEAEDYRGAWKVARQLLKSGGKAPQIDEAGNQGEPIKLEPGAWTVVAVVAEEATQDELAGAGRVSAKQLLTKMKELGLETEEATEALAELLRQRREAEAAKAA